MIYDKFKGYTFTQEWDQGNYEVEVKPTFKLQMKSLELFADELGYELNGDCSFECMHLGKTDKQVVSFNTMRDYHNFNFCNPLIINHRNANMLRENSERLGFSSLAMLKAIDSKLVQQVHLQLKKGKKNRGASQSEPVEIQVQSHMIKFV